MSSSRLSATHVFFDNLDVLQLQGVIAAQHEIDQNSRDLSVTA
jgi:hypothetical protein